MMSMTCQNLELGRMRLDFVACGSSSNASLDRFSVKYSAKGVFRTIDQGYWAQKLRYLLKTPETLLNGIAPGLKPLFYFKGESRGPISLTNLLEVVADDLQTLIKNLPSIVGTENPLLMSAAEYIFGFPSVKSHSRNNWPGRT